MCATEWGWPQSPVPVCPSFGGTWDWPCPSRSLPSTGHEDKKPGFTNRPPTGSIQVWDTVSVTNAAEPHAALKGPSNSELQTATPSLGVPHLLHS